ncbi:MAG: acetyl-CoA acetyltransferase [Hadesarchaea archaeon B3_Hades]|nr:MAG: acetyl-CoA acetyltransferase [Hadesarchaea archaeon B3_Hades]
MEVGIVSYGHTKFGVLEQDTPDLIKEAMDGCLKNVENGISPKEIDCVIVSCVDNAFSEQHQTGTLAWEYLGNPDAYGFKVESACVSGSIAIYRAKNMIERGEAKNVLVVGFEKMNKFGIDRITEFLTHGSSPEERKYGITQPGAYALLIRLYANKYDVTEDDWADISVKNHKNAFRNPWAHFHKDITKEGVMNSRMIADPIRLFHCSTISDGAASVLLSADPKKYTDTPVFIKGMGVAHDYLLAIEREDPTFLLCSKRAADQAYKEAGKSPKDVDIVEVHDAFTPVEPMCYEALGLAKKGEGAKLVREGVVMFDGSLPVNVSGGLKAKGHPVGATHVGTMVEMFLQLRGEAGERQVPDRKTAIIEGHGGTGSVAIVSILER